MAIPREYQRLAKLFGVTRSSTQTDEEFMQWLDNLGKHRDLMGEARDLGVPIQAGMKSAEIRRAVHNRRIEILREKGFVVGATVKLGERTVTIKEIVVVDNGLDLRVTVHYWIVAPWTGANNRGRANHMLVKEFLEKAELIS